MLKLNKIQQKVIFNKWETNNVKESYLSYRRKARGMLCIEGVAVIFWCGMYCCIETDGLSHT